MDSYYVEARVKARPCFRESSGLWSAMEYSSCILQSFSTFTQKSCTSRGWSCSGKQVAGCLFLGGSTSSTSNIKHKCSAAFQIHVKTLGPNSSLADPVVTWLKAPTKTQHRSTAQCFCPKLSSLCKMSGTHWFDFTQSLAGQENQSRTSLAEDNAQSVRLTEPFVVFYAAPFSSKQAMQLVNVIIGQMSKVPVQRTTEFSKVKTEQVAHVLCASARVFCCSLDHFNPNMRCRVWSTILSAVSTDRFYISVHNASWTGSFKHCVSPPLCC